MEKLGVIGNKLQQNNSISWELGELIGTATGNKSGLMSVEDKKRLGRRFFKGYTKLVESKYWYNHYVALIFGASPASNLGSLIAIDWKGNELISVTRFFGNNDNVKLYLGSNPETNMYELWLGLIGLDGDGSEFIIQSRESIDLDSKTVETLPSYLKVISISWQKNNDFSELGGLIGIATKENKGLSDSVQALNSTIYNISTGNKETALFKVCDYGSNINHILHIYSAPNSTLDSCNYIRVILSDLYIFVNKLFEKGYNSIRLFKDRKSFYVYVYSSVWTRTKIEVFSENPDLFYFTNVTDEISISDLEEISISWKI